MSSKLYNTQQEKLSKKRDFENMTVGQGKAVHVGHRAVNMHTGEIAYFASCGADHQTNRGTGKFSLSQNEVTCKRCLNQTLTEKHPEMIQRHSAIEFNELDALEPEDDFEEF